MFCKLIFPLIAQCLWFVREKVAAQVSHVVVFHPDSWLSDRVPRSLSRLMVVVEMISGSRIIIRASNKKDQGSRVKGQGLRIRPRLFTVRQDPTLLVEVDGGSWDRGRANITWHTALSWVWVNLVRGRYTIISPYITDGKFCILMAVTPVALDSGIIHTGNIKSYWGPLLVIW